MGENRLRKHRWALKERMLAVSDGVDEKAELLPPLRSSSRPVRLCRLRSVGCSGQTPNMAAGILTRCFEAVDMPSQSRLDAPARKVRGYYLDGPGSLGASAYCRDDWLGGSRKGKRRKEKEKREKERIVHKIRWRMVALPRTIHQIENCVPGLWNDGSQPAMKPALRQTACATSETKFSVTTILNLKSLNMTMPFNNLLSRLRGFFIGPSAVFWANLPFQREKWLFNLHPFIAAAAAAAADHLLTPLIAPPHNAAAMKNPGATGLGSKNCAGDRQALVLCITEKYRFCNKRRLVKYSNIIVLTTTFRLRTTMDLLRIKCMGDHIVHTYMSWDNLSFAWDDRLFVLPCVGPQAVSALT